MLEKTKKVMKGSVSEKDISTLLQRYTATTVLALLQEVAHCPDVKIDWNTLVKNTSTGISDAREYQMLWHHLAYRHALLGKLESGASPLDDDSDLEYEVQAFPTVSSEDLTEAAACVKVLVASGLPSESSLAASSIVEAPLTINIPNGPSSRASSNNLEATCSMQGTNITVPVSLQKLPLPAVTPAEGLDANGTASGSMPPRRKRKPWSEAEDMELIAAVQKCGEGNWANILRGDFKGDRTASQLSQRWANIRKRRGNLNVGPNYSGSQLSEAWRAAHHAMSLALDMPVKNLAAARPAAGTNTPSNSVLPPIGTTGGVTQAQNQTQEGCDPTKSSPIGSVHSIAKTRVSSIKPSIKPTIGSDSALRATAVAAGARIICSSDAASFIKATQTKSVVHLKPTGSSSTKLPGPSGMSLQSETQSNVNSDCAGPEAKPCSSHAGTVTNMVALPAFRHTPSTFATSSNMSSEQTNALISSLPSEVLPTQEVKTTEEIKVSTPVYSPEKEVLEDGSCGYQNVEREQVEDRALSLDREAEFKKQRTDVKKSDGSLNTKTSESDHIVIDNQAEARQVENDNVMMVSPVRGNNHSALEVNCENHGTDEKCADSLATISDECGEKLDVMRKNEAGNEIEGEDNVK